MVKEYVYEKVNTISKCIRFIFYFNSVWGFWRAKEPSKESQKSDKYEYEYYEVLNDGKEETLMSRLNIKIKWKFTFRKNGFKTCL